MIRINDNEETAKEKKKKNDYTTGFPDIRTVMPSFFGGFHEDTEICYNV